MDIKKALLEEHSKAQCDKIVAYIGSDKARFATLMNLFFEGEYRITQRAAWPVNYCVRKHPELIKPYFKTLLDNLDKPGLHPAIIRNTVRLLQDLSIPEAFHGQIMHTCFRYLQSNEIPVAIKAFSLTILQNLSQQYPEIIPEIRLIIEERWDHETAAFRSRAKKIRVQTKSN